MITIRNKISKSTSGFFGCTTSRSFSCVSLSAEMFAGVFTETSFPSQVLPLKIMSRLHWPASGALWDLRFFKHSQPKCSFHLNTSHLSSWFFKPREVTPVSQASDLFTWSRHGLAPTKLVPGSEHSFLSESPR